MSICYKKNQIERLVYCNVLRGFNENFNDAIFIDETTIELCNLGRYRWHKNLPNESHPETVHVLAGISRVGATAAVIFKGKMKAFDFLNLFSLEISHLLTKNSLTAIV